MAITMKRTLVASLVVLIASPGGDAFAGRGGGGGGRAGSGGGGRAGGGGGGFSGGGMSRPAAGHNPGFSSPRPSMPSAGGGMSRPAQNFNPGTAGGNISRPSLGANTPGARPQIPTTLPSRPPVGNIGNRPGGGGNNIANRPGGGANTVVNRPGAGGSNVLNRPGGGNTVVNRPNFGGNTINNVNINNIHNNNFNGNNWPGRYPYNSYHQNWVHGSWNYHYPNYNWGYFGGGFAAGMATWALASSLTSWGYSSYYNPYYAPSTVVIQQPVIVGQPLAAQSVYDYSQPINTVSAAPEPTAAENAVAVFDQAREAFKAGDYATALQQTQTALAQMPNDPTLHEFRALILFAQNQYDGAAAGLYAVLTAGPGWDWTTMVGLYPNVEVYTAQLRALEDFTVANPTSAPSKFVLAYHYLTQGFPDNAAAQLREVVKLQPGDKLSAKLLAGLDAKGSTSTPVAANAPTDVPPADPTPALPAISPAVPVAIPASTLSTETLVGIWVANPSQNTTITLTVAADHKFSWVVGEQSGKRSLAGISTLGNDTLTLAPESGDALVGKVAWRDANGFTFQAGGGGPNDPGLAFRKSTN